MKIGILFSKADVPNYSRTIAVQTEMYLERHGYKTCFVATVEKPFETERGNMLVLPEMPTEIDGVPIPKRIVNSNFSRVHYYKAVEFFEKHKPDYMIVTSYEKSYAVILAAIHCGIPYALYINGYYFMCPHSSRMVPKKENESECPCFRSKCVEEELFDELKRILTSANIVIASNEKVYSRISTFLGDETKLPNFMHRYYGIQEDAAFAKSVSKYFRVAMFNNRKNTNEIAKVVEELQDLINTKVKVSVISREIDSRTIFDSRVVGYPYYYSVTHGSGVGGFLENQDAIIFTDESEDTCLSHLLMEAMYLNTCVIAPSSFSENHKIVHNSNSFLYQDYEDLERIMQHIVGHRSEVERVVFSAKIMVSNIPQMHNTVNKILDAHTMMLNPGKSPIAFNPDDLSLWRDFS